MFKYCLFKTFELKILLIFAIYCTSFLILVLTFFFKIIIAIFANRNINTKLFNICFLMLTKSVFLITVLVDVKTEISSKIKKFKFFRLFYVIENLLQNLLINDNINLFCNVNNKRIFNNKIFL